MIPLEKKSYELESRTSQKLFLLEMNSDFKAYNIAAANEIASSGSITITAFVPVPQLKSFQKTHVWIIHELNKF